MADPDTPDRSTPSSPTPGVDRRTLQRARRREARRRRRRWPRRLLFSLLALVVLAVAAGAGTWAYARYRFDQIKKIHARHLVAQPAPGQPFDVLLVGSDSRSFVGTTPKKKQEFETPTSPTTAVGGQRSDVIIVARFVPATKQVWLLSIPRDLWVHVPGHGPESGPNRINAAFNTGPDLLIQTIEQVLGIPINHYVSVTFTGFQAMVNALGGVTMDFPDPVKDAYSGLDVTQTGCQAVDGATALELVRARHLYYEATGTWQYDGLSDFSRIQRQDAFFRAVLTKLDRVKLDPLTLNSFLGAAVKDLTIDTTLSESDLVSIAEQFHGLSQGSLHTETLPTYGFTTTGGADVLGLAVPQAQQVLTAFRQVGATTTTAGTGGGTVGSSTTTTSTAAVAPSQVDVRVLNGVDFTQPIASETAAGLRQLGFTVTGAANATAEGVATTEIEYAAGHRAAAQAVAAHVSGATQLVTGTGLGDDQVVLVVGSSFTGVHGTAGATPATSAGGASKGSTPAATSSTGGSSTGGSSTATSSTTSTPTSSTGAAATAPTGASTTTTTTPPAEVYTNTQAESWNPVPCVQ